LARHYADGDDNDADGDDNDADGDPLMVVIRKTDCYMAWNFLHA